MRSAVEIDRAIIDAVADDWLKVARIVAVVAHDGDHDVVAERIASLVQEGRLEGQGNLSSWRHSEVRLAPTKL
jgi:hypothetical protein